MRVRARARGIAAAASLLACPLWGISLAQQAASAPAAATAAEPHPAAAAVPVGPTVYNVELIVFRTNATLGTPENWSAETAQAPATPTAADGETGAPVSERNTSYMWHASPMFRPPPSSPCTQLSRGM